MVLFGMRPSTSYPSHDLLRLEAIVMRAQEPEIVERARSSARHRDDVVHLQADGRFAAPAVGRYERAPAPVTGEDFVAYRRRDEPLGCFLRGLRRRSCFRTFRRTLSPTLMSCDGVVPFDQRVQYKLEHSLKRCARRETVPCQRSDLVELLLK